jgi:hypothetical protein
MCGGKLGDVCKEEADDYAGDDKHPDEEMNAVPD